MRLVSGPRMAGKTTHLLRQMVEQPEAMLVVVNSSQREMILKTHAITKAGLILRDRIFTYDEVLGNGLVRLSGLMPDGKYPVMLIDNVEDFLRAVFQYRWTIGDITTSLPIVKL